MSESRNGKVDLTSLPSQVDMSQQKTVARPETETEKQIALIWQELIGLKNINRDDNFFHLGGHSLLATRLIVKINDVFDVTLPFRAVFNKESTLREQALMIDALRDGNFEAGTSRNISEEESEVFEV